MSAVQTYLILPGQKKRAPVVSICFLEPQFGKCFPFSLTLAWAKVTWSNEKASVEEDPQTCFPVTALLPVPVAHPTTFPGLLYISVFLTFPKG